MVAAAERLFAEHGYHGVSMDEIAAASGITKPMLYDYFGSKEGLFLACMERARGRLFEAIGGAVRSAEDAEAGTARRHPRVPDRSPTSSARPGRSCSPRAGASARPRRRSAPSRPGLIAQLLRELPGWEREPDAEELDALAHIFVGAAEAIAFWAVERDEVRIDRVADYLMAVLWPAVRELPSRAIPRTTVSH